MTGWLVIAVGLVVVVLLLDAAATIFEDRHNPEPERMSARWLAQFNAAEHEDEEARS